MTMNLEHVARLARLNLEGHDFKPEINKILAWVEVLQEVENLDAECVEAPILEREDADPLPDQSEAILRNAPTQRLGYFVVPKVIE